MVLTCLTEYFPFYHQVHAEDRDIGRKETNISYSLQGYGTEYPNRFFTINSVTGDIYLQKPLDRDAPLGRANFQVMKFLFFSFIVTKHFLVQGIGHVSVFIEWLASF